MSRRYSPSARIRLVHCIHRSTVNTKLATDRHIELYQTIIRSHSFVRIEEDAFYLTILSILHKKFVSWD